MTLLIVWVRILGLIKLNRLWGLCNLQRYKEIEGFVSFLACDYGTKGANNGDYVFGTGNSMLEDLWKSNCGFEGFNMGTTSWPRVTYKAGGQSSKDLEEIYGEDGLEQ